MDVLVVQEGGSKCLSLPNQSFCEMWGIPRQWKFKHQYVPGVGDSVIYDVDHGGEADG